MAESGTDDTHRGEPPPPGSGNSNATAGNGAFRTSSDRPPAYAALDLGTNNCRLLVARPSRRGFVVLDAFSRIIRLGEGVSASRRLSDVAINRTIDALRVCANKMVRQNVTRARLVATQACRMAENGEEFIDRVKTDLGLSLEILTPETEARLAVSGCVPLLDQRCDMALVFDIGGGSSELIWLDLSRTRKAGREDRQTRKCETGQPRVHHRTPRTSRVQHLSRDTLEGAIVAWTSLPVGVVTLAEKFGGRHVTDAQFEGMVTAVTEMLIPFEAEHGFREKLLDSRVHFLGTSGTVTTVAGIQLRLPRYDRSKVDGCWLEADDVRAVTYDLLGRSYDQRVAEPCIGRDRADLVLAGCAILEAMMRMWPVARLRVADRGLREGILAVLMAEDGYRLGDRRDDRKRRR